MQCYRGFTSTRLVCRLQESSTLHTEPGQHIKLAFNGTAAMTAASMTFTCSSSNRNIVQDLVVTVTQDQVSSGSTVEITGAYTTSHTCNAAPVFCVVSLASAL